MAKTIFLSYRRDDSQHAADRLYQVLVRRVPRRNIFMDVANIRPGAEYVEQLDDRVATSDVVLALIGPGWADARDESGRRRLDDPHDFVRVEIGLALKSFRNVVPVLLDGAPLPSADELPPDLAPLERKNAVELRRATFAEDAERLMRGIGLGGPPKSLVLGAVGAAAFAALLLIGGGAYALWRNAAPMVLAGGGHAAGAPADENAQLASRDAEDAALAEPDPSLQIETKSAPPPEESAPPGEAPSAGSENELNARQLASIAGLQSLLKAEGFDVGEVDGEFGGATGRALGAALGRLHAARQICVGPDDQLWRDRMSAVLDQFATSTSRRKGFIRAFNQSYGAELEAWTACTPELETKVGRLDDIEPLLVSLLTVES